MKHVHKMRDVPSLPEVMIQYKQPVLWL